MSLWTSSSGPKWHIFPGVRLFLLQQTSVQYRYLPLLNDEIRLIELRPSCFGHGLSISFRYISVKEAANSYEALSYTWGNTTLSHVLLCGDSHLKITTSLQSALLNLRLDSAPRMLWVDAVCINQSDILERGKQVVLMEQVYRNASKTVVYLGDRTVDSDLAAEYLENHMWRVRGAMADFINQKRVAQDADEMLEICIKTLGTSQAKLFEGFDPNAVQDALVNLLSRPWFRRIWVIQEFVVSPNVDMYCGKTLCEWGSFSMMFYYSFMEANINWDHITPPDKKLHFFRGLTQIMQMHELRQKFHNKDDDKSMSMNLVWLLSRCRTAEATVPVDKIFALLNLSPAAHNLEPDYLKSKADVYREFAELALEDGRDIISEAALTNRTDSSLPSWVPDWSEPPARINLSHILVASEGFLVFNVHGSHKQDQSYVKHRSRILGHTLFLKGVILQTVTVVGRNRPVPVTNVDESPNLTNLISILSYIQLFLEMIDTYPTGEEVGVVAGILLEANQGKGSKNVRSFWENTQSRDLLFEPELSALTPHADNLHEAMRLRRLEDPQGYANMCRAIAGRRFAITDQGYAGLVPDTTEDGDKICILEGFNVPYVLRQVGDHYILVGDAYVHGVMLGEAFLRDESLNDSLVEIAIS